MKKSTKQLEQDFPSLWDALQETSFPKTIWEPIEATEDGVSPFVDMIENATIVIAIKFQLTKQQAALLLVETLFTRIEGEQA